MTNEDRLFITENINNDTSKLLFKYHKDENKRFLINQIGKRQKTKVKLPILFKNLDFIFPQNSKAIEQCSSELSANIKASCFSGDNFLDLTGGLGVDTYFISKNFKHTYYNEKDLDLYNLANINYPNFNNSNLSAEEFVKRSSLEFDLIYIDPDRRDIDNNKLYKLEDMNPNILEIISKINSKNYLIKLSPIFEIKELNKYFDKFDVWLISINNELKELLIHIHEDAKSEIKIFIVKDEIVSKLLYYYSENNINLKNEINAYLYEPDVALLKANLQDQIAIDFKLNKLNNNTHYYFSDDLIDNFPGNIYKVKSKLRYNKNDFAEKGVDSGIIKIRNFDDTLSSIKKKLNIKESNKQYLFFMKDFSGKNICVVCDKL